MSTPLSKSKQSFFKSISKYSYFCLICSKEVESIQKEFQIEENLNQHLILYDHLQTIREIISQQQLIQKQVNFHSEYQQQERKQLFDFSIARELNQTGIAVYLGLFQVQIYIFKIAYPLLKISFLKRKRLKKNKSIFQKEKLNFRLINSVIFQMCKHDSVSALNLIIKAKGYDTKRRILIQKRKQLNLNIIIAKKSILYCQQFMRILLEQKYIRVALLVLILFKLDLILNCLPQLRFVDVLQNKTYKSINNNGQQSGIPKIYKTLELAVKLTLDFLSEQQNSNIIPSIKKISDIQSLLIKIKQDLKIQIQLLSEEAKQFIKGFNFSAIKSIKKQLNPYSKAQNQQQTNALFENRQEEEVSFLHYLMSSFFTCNLLIQYKYQIRWLISIQ